MASVKGGLSNIVTLSVHAQVAAAISDSTPSSASGQVFPMPASFTASLDSVSGGTQGSGFDSVTGPGHASFAGIGPSGGVDPVIATQNVTDSGVTINFTDGSSLTVAGVTNLHGLFH